MDEKFWIKLVKTGVGWTIPMVAGLGTFALTKSAYFAVFAGILVSRILMSYGF